MTAEILVVFFSYWFVLILVLLIIGGALNKEPYQDKTKIGEPISYSYKYPILEAPTKNTIKLIVIFASWSIVPAALLAYSGFLWLLACLLHLYVFAWVCLPIVLLLGFVIWLICLLDD